MFSLKSGKATGNIYSFQFLIQNHGYSFAKQEFSKSNKFFFFLRRKLIQALIEMWYFLQVLIAVALHDLKTFLFV